MILQALKEYYDRKASDPSSDIAPLGWEWKEFLYAAEIDKNGKFVKFHDFGEQKNGKFRGHKFLVPSLGEKKGNGIKSNLLWENIEYMFGIPVPSKSKPNPDEDRIKKQHQCFFKKLKQINCESEKLKAAIKFCEINQIEKVIQDPIWKKVLKDNQSIVLSYQGYEPIANDITIKESISRLSASNKIDGVCLVTGEKDNISRLESPIKGLIGEDGSKDRSLVAFNIASFESFRKEKNLNAPIGKNASFAYTTALNELLSKDSQQKVLIASSWIVFWSAKRTTLEEDAFLFFSEPPKDNPAFNTPAIKAIYASIWNGTYSIPEDDTKFYVLGLSPNSARISVRTWHVGTVKEIGKRLQKHIDDLSIVYGKTDRALPLWKLLRSIAAQGEDKNIPPNLAGETMRSILEGLPYPETLLQAAIRRNRAEQNVSYPRASLIKACINRKTRFNNPNMKEELKMSLDPTNTNIGYRLGRLFATLEKIQEDANGSSTIRDSFFGAASSTPVTVFASLMRLSNHHLSKIEKEKPGLFVIRKKLLSEIIEAVDGEKSFPPHLRLDDQGRFAIGYYHQRQDFFTKKENNN